MSHLNFVAQEELRRRNDKVAGVGVDTPWYLSEAGTTGIGAGLGAGLGGGIGYAAGGGVGAGIGAGLGALGGGAAGYYAPELQGYGNQAADYGRGLVDQGQQYGQQALDYGRGLWNQYGGGTPPPVAQQSIPEQIVDYGQGAWDAYGPQTPAYSEPGKMAYSHIDPRILAQLYYEDKVARYNLAAGRYL